MADGNSGKKAKTLSTSFINFCDLFEYKGEVFYDTPDFPPVPTSDADKFIQVDARNLGRLDLIAFEQYRDPELWWVIALANNLEQVPTQMKMGQMLRIPAESTAKTFVQRKQ